MAAELNAGKYFQYAPQGAFLAYADTDGKFDDGLSINWQ